MGFDVPSSVGDELDGTAGSTENRSRPSKNKGKVPKRIHKAEREKLKREQLNELFLELAHSLELTQPNNGKASILCEAARLLKDLLGQIECLKKENASLLAESHYVTTEKNELKDENSTLGTQIEGLQSELETRVAHSKPDLNAPSSKFHDPELTLHSSVEPLRFPAANAASHQSQAVFVIPLHPDPQAYPLTTSNVCKPHARYPTATDSWPSQLLGEQLTAGKEVKEQYL